MKVAGFGDNIVDRFLDRGVDYPGGNSVNFAVFAKRLGASAAYVGTFGNDDNGRFIRNVLSQLDIDISRSIVRDGPNGVTYIATREGERVFLGGNGGGVTLTDPFVLEAADVDYLCSFDLVHSSAYSGVESQLEKLNGVRTLVSFDFSWEPKYRTDEYLSEVGPSIDLALISCGNLDDESVRKELVRLASFGPSLVLATLGSRGAVLFDGSEYFYQDAEPLKGPLVDTMGCGDAFCAAFEVQLLRVGWFPGRLLDSSEIRVAMRSGASYAAEQCLVAGAFGYGRQTQADPTS